MIIYKEIKGQELYLYMNGELIYKRWLDTGQSKVFDVMAYDKYTLASYRDIEHKNESIFIVKARLKMLSTDAGGRQAGIKTGYRPNHVFEYKNGHLLNSWIGEISFNDQSTIEPGEEKEVTVRFMMSMPVDKYIYVGRIWDVCEGPRIVAMAEIISIGE